MHYIGKNSGRLTFCKVTSPEQWPGWADRASVTSFIHQQLKPYEDTLADIDASFEYVFSSEKRAGGFVLLTGLEDKLVGALVVLNTGMGGYVPENLFLFLVVDAEHRNAGLGEALVQRALAECSGSIKLHCDLDNRARRFFERIGFVHRYNEMRLLR
jgi:GNAT superfamily N-acetyltransferase